MSPSSCTLILSDLAACDLSCLSPDSRIHRDTWGGPSTCKVWLSCWHIAIKLLKDFSVLIQLLSSWHLVAPENDKRMNQCGWAYLMQPLGITFHASKGKSSPLRLRFLNSDLPPRKGMCKPRAVSSWLKPSRCLKTNMKWKNSCSRVHEGTCLSIHSQNQHSTCKEAFPKRKLILPVFQVLFVSRRVTSSMVEPVLKVQLSIRFEIHLDQNKLINVWIKSTSRQNDNKCVKTDVILNKSSGYRTGQIYYLILIHLAESRTRA